MAHPFLLELLNVCFPEMYRSIYLILSTIFLTTMLQNRFLFPFSNPEQVSFPNVAIYFQRLSNLVVPFYVPSNHPYKFPAVDMDKSPVVILNSIGPVLHSVPFNSQTLKVSLFSSVTDKIHERLLHLIDNSTTFNSLTEFKIWLLKQLKPSKKQAVKGSI